MVPCREKSQFTILRHRVPASRLCDLCSPAISAMFLSLRPPLPLRAPDSERQPEPKLHRAVLRAHVLEILGYVAFDGADSPVRPVERVEHFRDAVDREVPTE